MALEVHVGDYEPDRAHAALLGLGDPVSVPVPTTSMPERGEAEAEVDDAMASRSADACTSNEEGRGGGGRRCCSGRVFVHRTYDDHFVYSRMRADGGLLGLLRRRMVLSVSSGKKG